MKTLPLRMLAVMICLVSGFLQAQPFDRQGIFGTNRIQHKQFKWRFITTENFEVYYYGEGYAIAALTAEYAEQELNRIITLVGNAPYSKTKIFVYQSINDLRQSNVGIKHQGVSMGGQTRFYRSQIEVAFTGNKSEYKKELIRSIADLFLFEMVYGGSFKNILRSSFLLSIPEWFLSGAARYIGYGWDKEMDDYMRDVFFNRNSPMRLSRLEGEEAEIAGQSVWNYLVIKYGPANMANVLSLTKLFRDEKSSIQNTLNIDFNTFLVNWKNFYLEKADELMEGLYIPEKQDRVKRLKPSAIFNKLEISPDGKKLAYSQTFKGRWKVKVFDMERKTTKTVLSGGYKVLNQRINKKIPLFSWQDSQHLVILSTRSWKNYLWTYSLDRLLFPKKRIKFRSFSNINDFDISEDGKRMVLSAELKGSSDIYLYNIKPRTYQILTSDEYDDITPRFMPDGKSIVFASNRKSDTLVVNAGELSQINEHFNLFQYEFGKTQKLRRITNTISYDHSPKPISSNTLLYLSDQRGITQVYKVDINTGYHTQLTTIYQSINNFDYDGQRLIYNINYRGNQAFFKIDSFNLDKTSFSPKTQRQEFLDRRYVEEMRRKAAEKKKTDEAEQQKDSIQSQPKVQLPRKPTANTDEIDTDNYQFENSTSDKPSERFIDRIKRINAAQPASTSIPRKEEIIKEVSRYYRQEFTVDNFSFTPFFDILRGFGMKADVALTDELENHKINVGMFGRINFPNNSLFFEYEYLKHRTDFSARYERVLFILNDRASSPVNQRYVMSTAELSFIYPFSIASRISVSPFFTTTRFSNLDFNSLAEPDVQQFYGGIKAEFVFDNTITIGHNVRAGTNFKARLESFGDIDHFQDSKRPNGGFGVATAEFRQYQRIHRNIILVFRGCYGAMLGAKPRKFLLGGIPNNVLFNDINREGPLEYDPQGPGTASVDRTDWILHRFVGPLRGFPNNKIYGDNYLLGNVELRFPIIKYFYRGNINNNFLRNFQIIGFYDIGTSWTGSGPFSEENSINTKIISAPPFSIKVVNYRQPFLMGYGAGIRSTVLGFNTKLDIAWGQEDNVVAKRPTFHLSLGLDF